MTTQTYSETRQAIYFTAGRQFIALACEILDDFRNSVECAHKPNVAWGIKHARAQALQAHKLFELGHEQCIASNLRETLNSKAWDKYSHTIDRFEERVRTHARLAPGASVVEWSGAEASPRPASF